MVKQIVRVLVYRDTAGRRNSSPFPQPHTKKSIWRLLKNTVAQWIEDQPFQLASSLSYYTLFSLAPLLIIVIAIAGFAFSRAAAEHQIDRAWRPERAVYGKIRYMSYESTSRKFNSKAYIQRIATSEKDRASD